MLGVHPDILFLRARPERTSTLKIIPLPKAIMDTSDMPGQAFSVPAFRGFEHVRWRMQLATIWLDSKDTSKAEEFYRDVLQMKQICLWRFRLE